MHNPSCQKPDDGLEIFRRLAAQFSSNFTTALTSQVAEVKRVEVKARCLAAIGELLGHKHASSDTQRAIAAVYDEVFADCVCSIYLAAQGLDKPAQLVLRRALELGLAAVYLWDLPHLFWGWKDLDQDLSFTDITQHLSSSEYLKYVASENGGVEQGPLFDVSAARNEYRALSNTVHGKVTTFESPLVDRFRHSDNDWKDHLIRVEKVQELILDLAKARFSVVREELSVKQPQIVPHS